MPKTPPYSKEFKREAVQLLRSSGRPIPQLAKELGVSPQSLRNWASQRDVDAAARRRPRGLSASENAPTAPEGVSVRPPRGAKRLGLDASKWQTGLDNSWPNAAPLGVLWSAESASCRSLLTPTPPRPPTYARPHGPMPSGPFPRRPPRGRTCGQKDSRRRDATSPTGRSNGTLSASSASASTRWSGGCGRARRTPTAAHATTARGSLIRVSRQLSGV